MKFLQAAFFTLSEETVLLSSEPKSEKRMMKWKCPLICQHQQQLVRGLSRVCHSGGLQGMCLLLDDLRDEADSNVTHALNR